MAGLVGLGLMAVAAAPAPVLEQREFHLPLSGFVEPADSLAFKRGFQLPRVEYVTSTGSTIRKQGMIAAVPLTGDAVFGIGLFGSKRKPSTLAPDPQLEKFRTKKKVAVGVTMRF